MRRILFWIFLILWIVAACYAAYWVVMHPGDLSVDWLGWRFEAPMKKMLIGVLLLVVLSALLWQLARFFMRSPRQFAQARADRRRRKAYRALTQGMVAVAAGDAVEAQRQARLAGHLLDDPPLTLLLEAQAAQLGGDEQAAARYFRAMRDRPEAAFLGLRGLLMQALKSGRDGEALGLARQAVQERPQTSWAVSTLLDLELKSGAWKEAEATLRRAEKLKVLDAAAAKRTRAILLTELARNDSDPDGAIGRLRDAVKLAPDLVPARALLGTMLARSGRAREGSKVIEQGWAAEPHAELAAAYAQIDPAEEPLARVRRFERLASFNPAHLESQLAIAGANLAASLWGAARGELDKALAQAGGELGASQRLARLMAHLEESEGTNPAAARRWLIAAASAPSDPAWTCEHCGTIAVAWSARCGHCHRFDSLEWRATSRPVPPALEGALPTTPALAAPVAAIRKTETALAESETPVDDSTPVDAARRVN